MNIILLVLGFILLLKGADWFVDGSSSIASRFGIPQLIIGLTIVAMGTSLPEAFVSITAALKSNAAITIGNVVGSNILNVGIILGITALIRPLHIQNSTIKYEMPFMMLVTLVLILQGINNTISRFDGIILWLFFLGYLYYIFRMTKNQIEEAEIKKTAENMKKVLTDAGAKVMEEKAMGQRELAYEINKFNTGYYFLFVVEADSKSEQEFNRVARINESLLRHIVVRVEDK